MPVDFRSRYSPSPGGSEAPLFPQDVELLAFPNKHRTRKYEWKSASALISSDKHKTSADRRRFLPSEVIGL
ncbi:hypothetical protein D0469_19075 [Peribacillus saganii]|uniref:Uncharacterized protein n=1 Tax=Peribacillus saganii TaxID=2303992 RepID=A0A372LDU0_9BACI|nr:hypothetical protein D0469_19075 [Peribacillus saganii]